MTPRAIALLAGLKRDLDRLEAELAGDAGGDADLADVAVPTGAEPAPAPEPLNAPHFVETHVAARRLGVTADTIRKWVRADPSLGQRLGGRWRVDMRRLRQR